MRRTMELLVDRDYMTDVWVSVYRVMVGFLLSAVFGVPLGILIGTNKVVEASVEPFVDFVRYLPVAGFIPLSILWLGLGDAQKVAVLFIGTFFQLVPMVVDATSSIPRPYLDTARTLGAGDLYIVRQVVVPFALPRIYDALRISVGVCWTYLIVAEIVAASSGIGFVIVQGQRYINTATIFVGLLTVGLLGLITDYGFKLFQPRLFPWTAKK